MTQPEFPKGVFCCFSSFFCFNLNTWRVFYLTKKESEPNKNVCRLRFPETSSRGCLLFAFGTLSKCNFEFLNQTNGTSYNHPVISGSTIMQMNSITRMCVSGSCRTSAVPRLRFRIAVHRTIRKRRSPPNRCSLHSMCAFLRVREASVDSRLCWHRRGGRGLTTPSKTSKCHAAPRPPTTTPLPIDDAFSVCLMSLDLFISLAFVRPSVRPPVCLYA